MGARRNTPLDRQGRSVPISSASMPEQSIRPMCKRYCVTHSRDALVLFAQWVSCFTRLRLKHFVMEHHQMCQGMTSTHARINGSRSNNHKEMNMSESLSYLQNDSYIQMYRLNRKREFTRKCITELQDLCQEACSEEYGFLEAKLEQFIDDLERQVVHYTIMYEAIAASQDSQKQGNLG